jgi:putative endonuclease
MAEKQKQLYRKQLGSWGEKEAEAYFANQGLAILGRNFRTRDGEIDLIVKDSEEIVFVEVKTRTSNEFGFPEEAVTEEKIEHLIEAAERYLEDHTEIHSWRIDVLAIIGDLGTKNLQFEWFKNVD